MMDKIDVRMPVDVLKRIDKLIEEGRFQNRSDAIREFVVQGLIREDSKKQSQLTYFPTARQK